MQSYIPLALIAAVAYALGNVIQKHLVGKLDEYAVAWGRYLFAAPFLLLFLYQAGIPHIDPRFWPIVLIVSICEVLIAVIWAKALKKAALSKTAPFLSFQPLFIAIGGYFVLRESLSLLQIAAMLTIVAGSYILNVEKDSLKNVLAPFKLMWHERGGMYVLFLCAVWGLLVPLDKQATLYSSPEFFSTTFFVLTTLLFIPVFNGKSRYGLGDLRRNSPLFLLCGLCSAVFMVFLFMAAKQGPIALVSSVAATNVLITVLFAGTFLRERNLLQRLVATGVMTLGSVMLTLH